MHECMMPTCARKADRRFAICTACYKMLPEELRMAISRAHIDGMKPDTMTLGMQHAIAAAQAWVLATFGGIEGKHDPGRWDRLVRDVRIRDEARAARRATEPAKNTPSHLRLVP